MDPLDFLIFTMMCCLLMNGVIRTAAFFGLLAVILGAFGAHALRETLVFHGTASVWQTAVFYQLVHTMSLLWLGNWVGRTSRIGRTIFLFWAGGIIIFSGSLYLLAFTDYKWLGAITPVGGACFLFGWIFLLFGRS